MSYDWDSIINPGNTTLFISVDDGAPCVAHCKLHDKSQPAVVVTSFQQNINESQKLYEKPVNFPAAGRYDMECDFIPQGDDDKYSNIDGYKCIINRRISSVFHKRNMKI